MKYALWAIGVPSGLAFVFLAVQTVASERVEVIDLYLCRIFACSNVLLRGYLCHHDLFD